MSANPQQYVVSKNKQYDLVCVKKLEVFQGELVSIKEWFGEKGESLHDDRNVIKRYSSKEFPNLEKDIVVKSFKTPNSLSRFIYTFFRASKAKRSFENSITLAEAGFSVPEPLAYIEFKDKGLLKESFYISEYLVFDCSLHEVFRRQADGFHWNEILPLVVDQGFKMHEKGVLHKDFSPGNVLVKKKDSGFKFSFVDLNRMYKGRISEKKGLASFMRLAHDNDSERMIVERYAACSKKDIAFIEGVFQRELKKYRSSKNLKQKFKSLLGK
jgi:serine/threonine protein kinase